MLDEINQAQRERETAHLMCTLGLEKDVKIERTIGEVEGVRAEGFTEVMGANTINLDMYEAPPPP